MIITTPLKTERLLLREFREDDWRAVHEYANDPEVFHYMPWGPSTETETREYVNKNLAYQQEEERKVYDLAIILRKEQQLIGAIGINLVKVKTAWIGYTLSRLYWGRGYMTEAAVAILRFGFEKFDLHRIYATCDTRNLASSKVMEKLAMRREGHMRQDQWLRGEWRDSYLYAILEDEWREKTKK
ncbi:MAG: GNAT family N-acetyltransferase [Planctomycetes bacterium]|nr:GNAT family N-acetyltransferase [Planctomycetota bacterium]